VNARGNLPLAVLISGRGSNMVAIAQACRAGQVAARIVLVLSDRASAEGLASARDLALPTAVIERTQYAAREEFERALRAAIDASGAEWVVLAGFMRVLSAAFVRHYEGRMLNIHPALLPAYKGLHTHRRVLAAGDTRHGASVHLVTAELDEGPVIAQASVPVRAQDTEDSLAARVLQLEHRLYPMVIGLIGGGRLEVDGGRVRLDGRALEAPLDSTAPDLGPASDG
jgi:phosphoribosylglycinamide formyltransferase-1